MAKALRAQGYEVLTLDFDERWKPDILVDIRRWDYKQFRPGDFHLVAASPPCTEYSTIMISRPRRLDEADELVNRARESIEYRQPELWWIENPRRGLLSRRSPVRGLRFIDVDYCMLSDWGYQKPTRFWCCDQIAQRGSVLCNGNCGNMVRHDDGVRRHRLAIGSRRAPSKVQMMAIPAGVIHHLCGFEGPPQGVLQVQVKAWQQHPQPPFQIGQVERRGGAVQLLMRITVLDGKEYIPIMALVDTGAQTNLIKRGLLPDRMFRPAKRRLVLTTVSGDPLEGGVQEAHVRLRFPAA